MIGSNRTSSALGARISAWPRAAQWGVLATVSALLSVVLMAAHLPAALLLGPLVCGIAFGVNGVHLSVPRVPYRLTQALIAAMVSASVTPSIVASFRHSAPLFTVVTLATLIGAAALGWLISRAGLIPGATAVFGTSPGAASAMVLLGEAEGADPRLVAFMQYVRVLFVAFGAAMVARFWAGLSGSHAPTSAWLGPVHWQDLMIVLVLAILGQELARRLRLQAWAILGPLLLLSSLHAAGWVEINLPRWLLAAAYALLGWQIGLGFRRDAWARARRVLPVIVGVALALMSYCGVLAWCLTRFDHVDALTAYLATSPGGLDSVSIIAASTPRVDLPFVVTLQSMRLLLVMLLAPMLTRWVVRHSPHMQTASEPG